MIKKKKSKSFKFLPFSPKQNKLLNWWREESPHHDKDMIIADGSIRSGKTIACICSFLLFTQETFPNGENFILAGKTMGALKKNVVKPMIQILTAWGWTYNYNRSENYIEIGNNTYYMYGANTEASQDALQGLTAAGAYADEAALFPQSFIDQMIGRCSVEGAKVFMNCNPEGPHHYVKAEFIDKAKEKNVYHLHFTMDDNLSLSQKVKDRFRRMFTGVFFKRFILGLWVASDGLIYQQFADNPDEFMIDDEWLQKNPIMYGTIGVDFGGNTSAHSFKFTGFTYQYKEVVTVMEYYRHERITPKQLNEDFIDFVRRVQSKYKCYEAYCDSAEQTLISGMEAAIVEAGITLDIKNAIKGPINDRIAFYNSMMAQGRYKIHKSCTHLKSAFEEAVYDEDEPTKDVRLDDGKMDIDSLDSQEYSTEYIQNDIMYINVA
ncbi:PBSX family phage terminase large subunit [Anaerosporobacter faecicola]|uniref:PBSX family phage terminase large subunit n=1 Tax=Anaerosporobacter faecicola TaxID=2718714 RepID=UPI001A9B7F77|nr:PBSX family phage terminase large subunit [Anaerosporobacter faecicola]